MIDTIEPALKCYTCGDVLTLDNFYISKSNLTGYSGSCKSCIKKYQKEYRKRKEVIERNKEYHKNYANTNRDKLYVIQKKYRDNNKLKAQARSKVNHAIRDKRLFKSEHCEYCCAEVSVYAHHTSYEEFMWLNVIWLCKNCHLLADKDEI